MPNGIREGKLRFLGLAHLLGVLLTAHEADGGEVLFGDILQQLVVGQQRVRRRLDQPLCSTCLVGLRRRLKDDRMKIWDFFVEVHAQVADRAGEMLAEEVQRRHLECRYLRLAQPVHNLRAGLVDSVGDQDIVRIGAVFDFEIRPVGGHNRLADRALRIAVPRIDQAGLLACVRIGLPLPLQARLHLLVHILLLHHSDLGTHLLREGLADIDLVAVHELDLDILERTAAALGVHLDPGQRRREHACEPENDRVLLLL